MSTPMTTHAAAEERRKNVLEHYKIDTSRTKARPAPPALTGAPEAPKNYRLDQLYICTHGGHVFEEGRCAAEGTLHRPDGRMVPGCFFCGTHARAIIAEYAEKLGETWYFRRFVPAHVPWEPPRQTPPSALRSVYVAGVREVFDNGPAFSEQVDDDDDAEFWSVYGVHNGDRFGFFDGASECLSDWPTREQAEAAAVRVVLGQYEARDEGPPQRS